ncbi:MAG: bacteriorhodopsin [Halobacteriales archaeon]
MASGLALVWFALGLVGTAVGAVAFLGAGWTEPDPWKRRFYVYSTAAAGAMAGAYVLAVLGIGRLPIGGGDPATPVFWARAIAWTGIAPVFLFGLGRFAGAEPSTTQRAAALGAGVAVASLLAALLPPGPLSMLGWVAAGACLVGVLALLFGPIGSSASRRHRSVVATYGRVRATLAVALAATVGVGVAGVAGLDVLPRGATLPLLLAVDVGGVVLPGFFLCRSRAVLHWARPEDRSEPDDAAETTAN